MFLLSTDHRQLFSIREVCVSWGSSATISDNSTIKSQSDSHNSSLWTTGKTRPPCCCIIHTTVRYLWLQKVLRRKTRAPESRLISSTYYLMEVIIKEMFENLKNPQTTKYNGSKLLPLNKEAGKSEQRRKNQFFLMTKAVKENWGTVLKKKKNQLKIWKSPSSAPELSQPRQNVSNPDQAKGSVTAQMWLHDWGIKDMVPH